MATHYYDRSSDHSEIKTGGQSQAAPTQHTNDARGVLEVGS